MGKFDYRAKSIVTAAQWRGDNLDEIKELLQDVIDGDEEGPYVYAEWIEPFYYASAKIDSPGYYMLRTEWDEFDPGVWIVVYEDGEIEGMSDEQFNKMFEKS